MDRNRQGQIAFLLIENKFQFVSMERREELRQEIENEAKAMGIPAIEAVEFAKLVSI